MRATNKTRIALIANEARRWAEQSKPQWWQDDLAKMCARASGELFKRLNLAGFKPVIVFVRIPTDWWLTGHAYVRCCGYTIDITATQFYFETGVSYKPVEIVSRHKAAQSDLWKPSHEDVVCHSVEEALAYQTEHNWPKDQWCNKAG